MSVTRNLQTVCSFFNKSLQFFNILQFFRKKKALAKSQNLNLLSPQLLRCESGAFRCSHDFIAGINCPLSGHVMEIVK